MLVELNPCQCLIVLKKLAYQAPVFTAYGTVTTLTGSGSGRRCEGGRGTFPDPVRGCPSRGARNPNRRP